MYIHIYKNIYKILGCFREFSARSPSPVGDFENPFGQHAMPSGQSGGWREARTGDGDLAENSRKKPEFCIYFFDFYNFTINSGQYLAHETICSEQYIFNVTATILLIILHNEKMHTISF